MKLSQGDLRFGRFIRHRDARCVRCGGGSYDSIQCSHYFGRTRWTVRFDPENNDALCHACHRFWEKEDREAYRQFKVKQLGQARYDALCERARKTLKDFGKTKKEVELEIREKYKEFA